MTNIPPLKTRLLASLALSPAVLLLLVWIMVLSPETGRHPFGLVGLSLLATGMAFAISHLVTLFILLLRK